MRTHTGDTGFSCSRCGKILASRVTQGMHLEGCGREKNHFCMECNQGYVSKQALVAHMKAKHGPEPAPEDLVCPTCGKTFKIVKTMHEHLAVHRGPYPCLIDVCIDIYVMMSSDLYGTCSSADVIVMSRTNSNLLHGRNCNPCIGGPCRHRLQYL